MQLSFHDAYALNFGKTMLIFFSMLRTWENQSSFSFLKVTIHNLLLNSFNLPLFASDLHIRRVYEQKGTKNLTGKKGYSIRKDNVS